MRTSVIIPALNEASHIRAAIDSAWSAGAHEVIVVDGNSDDKTCELAQQSRATVVSSVRGRGPQQNAGAARATGDLLLFLHADSTLGTDCLICAVNAVSRGHSHGAFHQRIRAQGIGFRLLEFGNRLRVRMLGLPYGDQAIFVTRDVFFAAGGFPNIAVMEDWWLMRRLRHDRWPILLPSLVHTSARRWQKYGIVRQTLANWRLCLAATLGAPEEHFKNRYTPHNTEAPFSDGSVLEHHPSTNW